VGYCGVVSETVLTERRGNILVITINRPEVRNAFDLETADAMSRAVDALDGDPELRAGVLTGAGGHFSSGMDMKAFLTGNVPYVAHRGIFGIVNEPPTTPLIGAVEGAALAGGFELMLVCDLVVAAADVELGINEVQRGTCASAGGLMKLPHRIPIAVAAEMALTGRSIGAERALELGLVNRIAEPGEALAGALELAGSVARNAPLALEASKRVLYGTLDWTSDEAWAKQGEIVGPIWDSEDAREGSRAFKEKREPRWRGR
jgi:enoyl-CoA hydratase